MKMNIQTVWLVDLESVETRYTKRGKHYPNY